MGIWERIWDGVKFYGRKTVNWVKEHPWETAGIVGGTIGAGVAGHKLYKKHKNHRSNHISFPADNTVIRQSRINHNPMRNITIDIGQQLGKTIQRSDSISNTIGKQLQNHGSVVAESLRECSKLFSMGYSTRKSMEERHAILDSYINVDGVERAKKHLQFLINTRSAVKNGIYANAVSKWQEDLDYLSGK